MKFLAAFDKFKDALSATELGDLAMSTIAAELGGECAVQCAPLTDGGEGFCRILTGVAGGTLSFHEVSGPLGAQVSAPIGWVPIERLPASVVGRLALDCSATKTDHVAVIELASAAGLELVADDFRNPWQTATCGVGELIRIAGERGASAILIGLGGSATNDLGLGALSRLGFALEDAEGKPVGRPCPVEWARVSQLKVPSPLPKLPPLRLACDVDNPLLGERGASAVFGPQKGLKTTDFSALEAACARMAGLLEAAVQRGPESRRVPGAGAAGGIAYGLSVALGAQIIPGFALVQDWIGLAPKIGEVDCVLTGEGRFDRSSLAGKGPFAVIEAAVAAKKRVIVLCGAIEAAAASELKSRYPQVILRAITPSGEALPRALALAPQYFQQTLSEVLRQMRNP